MTQRLTRFSRDLEACRRLREMEEIGPLNATALVAALGNGHDFRSGRQVAAWLGLVPRQHSSGGKTRLAGISKRGNSYLRCLLIHGARSVPYPRTCVPVLLAWFVSSKALGSTELVSRMSSISRDGCGKCAYRAVTVLPERYMSLS